MFLHVLCIVGKFFPEYESMLKFVCCMDDINFSSNQFSSVSTVERTGVIWCWPVHFGATGLGQLFNSLSHLCFLHRSHPMTKR